VKLLITDTGDIINEHGRVVGCFNNGVLVYEDILTREVIDMLWRALAEKIQRQPVRGEENESCHI